MPKEDRKQGDTWSSADGMAVDRNGNVYVTCKSGLNVFGPSGKLLGIVEFPDKPANCTFGGDNLSTLFVTCRKKIYAIQTQKSGVSMQ